MKWKWNNGFRSVLRNEAGDDGGGGQPTGLIAGLEKFIDENPGTTATDKGGQEAESSGGGQEELPIQNFDDDPPPKFEAESREEEENDGGGEEIGGEEEEFDLGLPTLGEELEKEEKPAGDFDSAKFDAETNAVLAAIEKSGHPGEAYKEMRAELKALKESGLTVPSLQSRIEELETQNKELSAKAAEVEAMQERVKSVTSRNAELLLEELPEYQEKVTRPHTELSETVAALAEARGVPAVEIWAAIKENDPVARNKAIDALEDKIGARNALLVQNAATDLRVIAREDQRMRKDAEAIVARSKEADRTMSEEEKIRRASAFKTATSQSFERYASKIPGFVDDTGNMTDLAKTAQARGVTVDAGNLESGDLGYMVFTAQALPQALRHIKSLERENRDLRVAAGEKAKNIAPGGSPKKTQSDKDHTNPETGAPRTFMEGFMAQDFSSGT